MPQDMPELSFSLPLTPHPYLTEQRGLLASTCQHFGVGYCSRGMLRDMVAIPIHDHHGRLVAYAGRRLEVSGDEARYRFPGGFHKSAVTYNAWRIPDAADTIIVVEGFFDVFHLHQSGFPNTVALMGSSASPRQMQWLLDRGKPVCIMLDGDPAGWRSHDLLVGRLQRANHPYRSCRLDPGRQPEHLSVGQIRQLLVPEAL